MSVERLAEAVLASGADLEPAAVAEAARRLRPQVAPMLDAEADRRVVAQLLGLGPIQPLVDDPANDVEVDLKLGGAPNQRRVLFGRYDTHTPGDVPVALELFDVPDEEDEEEL